MSYTGDLHRTIMWLLFSLLLSCTVGRAPCFAADGAPDLSSLIKVIAVDANGGVLAEAYRMPNEEWSNYSTGDSLELERGWDLSTNWDRAEGVCPPGEHSVVVNFQVVVRRKDAATSCPYPMHPSKVLYMAKLDNGAIVILRLQAGTKPASAKVQYLDKTYGMRPATPAEVARIQTTGTDPGVDWSTTSLENKVSLVDNKSLIASLDKAGQAGMLDRSADLLAEILELYYTRWGGYPSSLSQLYTGPHAVITAIPRNPYDWKRNLDETQSAPRLTGGVRYIREGGGAGAQSDTATGYWLAVTSKGAKAKPTRELPQGVKPPARTSRWIEQHHDPTT
jgi:hypothetical protein